ncbi:MAG: copper resistance protein NlpE N-terminal domain-containing protein [Flavihumibacter sp.]|nr:copper resistance protein NlpE N-terminal domain-containing protein [Flavihumibacter sp.]
MKMLKNYTAVALIVLAAAACNNQSQPAAVSAAIPASKDTTQPVAAATADNSATSLDWAGDYKGVVPCADCEGIETSIRLNADKTYVLATRYIGKKQTAIEEKGNFSWNDAGTVITLAGIKDKPTQYQVGENKITQLDIGGNKITGNLADKYVLQKQAAAASLTETYWKLTELMGKPVPAPKEGRKELHIILKKQDNRITGFAGCNTVNGGYQLKEGNRIKFIGLITTLMACPDMQTEQEFLKILPQADNYSLNGDKLSLNKARMAPLARFEAVYLK